MNGSSDAGSPLHGVASLEQSLLESEAAIKRAIADLERIGQERAAALARAQALAAALPDFQKRIARGRGAQEQAVRERADLERRYADLLEDEQAARARFEQAEQRVEAFRAVEIFAKVARTAAESSGNTERAGREHDAEDRASHEREEAEVRLADLRAIAASVSSERADVERHVFAEREVETDVSADRLAAELERESADAEIARANHEAEMLDADAAHVRAEMDRLEDDKNRLITDLAEARRRLVNEASSRIEYLRGAEERKRLERMEAERIVAGMRAEEEALAQERAALERSERDRLERRRILERREAYDRALDERLERKRLAASGETDEALGDDLSSDDSLPPNVAGPAAPVPGIAAAPPSAAGSERRVVVARPFGSNTAPPASANGRPASRPRAPVPPRAVPAADAAAASADGGGFFGRFGRRRREAEPGEPRVDVASRIARDFGMLGETSEAPPPPPAPPSP